MAVVALVGMLAACSQQQFQRMQPVDGQKSKVPGLRGAFRDLPLEASPADVRILDENMTAWTERWRLMDRAQERVDVVYFIIYRDVFGMAFMGRLLELARAGKKVRILLDTHGTPDFSAGWIQRDYLQAMARVPTLEVSLYNPWGAGLMNLMQTFDLQSLIASNHDKILVVDGREGILGGRNISREYFGDPRDSEHDMADLDVLLVGREVARDMHRAFEREFNGRGLERVRPDVIDVVDPTDQLLLAARMMDLWLRADPLDDQEIERLNVDRRARDRAQVQLENDVIASWGHRPERATLEKLRTMAADLVAFPRLRGAMHAERPPVFTAPALILDTVSTEGPAINQINESLFHLIRNSHQEVVIQSPHMILTERLLDVFQNASERGVKLTLLTNSPFSSDSTVAQAMFISRWQRLLGELRSMRIFAMEDPLLFHSKALVFDGKATMVGSYNMDPFSYRINSEIVAVVWSEHFAKAISQLAYTHIQQGRPHVIEYLIQRRADGSAVRFPKGHPREGVPKARQGPEHHCDPQRLQALGVVTEQIDALRWHPLFRDLM